MSKKKHPFYKQDPLYLKEKEKYQDPVPSREFILKILEDFGRPVSLSQLIKKLEVEPAKEEPLNFRLRAMLRDGQLMQDRRGRYCLFKRLNLMRGTVMALADGSGFFIPEDNGQDLVLSAKEMRAVMHGDGVLAYKIGTDRRGRLEAAIHEVIDRAYTNVVGRYFEEHGVCFVVPDNKRLTQDISILPDETNGAKNGQIVLVEILYHPTKRAQAVGRVVHILGDHMAPGMETEIAILAHDIPATWPDEVLKATTNIPMQVMPEEIADRKDLRDLSFVTIDGEDARDFDDAVYCYEKDKGGYQLFVAIADVSHYVKVGSLLDKEAARRGNSVYFPTKVVPMLPEALSNGICSLNEKVDRLAMVAEIALTKDGKINRTSFYKAVIHSKARLTYNQVYTWLKQGFTENNHQDIWPNLQALFALFRVLLEKRQERGAIDFDTTETKIEFDQNRKIKKVVPVIRNDAHRLIEECMLVANMAVADYLLKAKIPALYRVHPEPLSEKVVQLRQFLGEFGLVLKGGDKPTPKDFQATLTQAAKMPERHLIETVMLRSLKQAQYLESNNGHFGLAYSAYTHFTSPIRRYPDLMVHRAIEHLLNKKGDKKFPFGESDIAKIGKHCSLTERRADEATRDVVSWLKCEYMQDKLGQEYTGRISSVTGFGIFVELDEIYVEGLVHVTSLTRDYYTFDAAKHRLVGERTGRVYRLGDPLKIIVARVDLNERKIDFDLSGEDQDE